MTPFTLKPCIKRYFILTYLAFYSAFSFAQTDILSKKINIPEFKGEVKELLAIIEKENNIVFSYSSSISLDYEVQFKEFSLDLNDFLTKLFKGKAIGYKATGNKIILHQIKDSENKAKLKQTVRGTILDEDSRLPLIGATVIIPGTDPIVGIITDVDGKFRFDNIPVGRVNLRLSYLGYDEVQMPNIEVNSGKEVVLNLTMRPSTTQIEEVTIKANGRKGEAINDLSLLSARSISVEETKRFTGGMDDPARMVTSYAGVNASPDGSSDIIVRGNSPKYMQWRVDGVEITSPYHMDDQNASFGAITVLNKSLLTTSDFYTGAFAPEYGNVLSNVMDVKLRNGNNEKFEATAGIGLMGTDITLEGPFKKGYGGSYLVNYRYSTIALMKDLGLLPGVEGVVNYQDATFKVILPSEKLGTFSVFGLAGLSGFSFKNVEATGISTPGAITDASILKDYDKAANLLNFAVTNTKSLTKTSYIKTSISYAANGFDDDLFEKTAFTENNQSGQVYDSTGNRKQIFESKIDNSQYQIAANYNNRLNARNKIQFGSRFICNYSDYYQNIYMHNAGSMVNVNDFKNDVNSLTNFVSWKHSFNDRVSFVTGIHNMNVLLNKKTTIEPRFAMNWKINNVNSIHLGYGKHSTAEKVHNYFTKVLQPDGSYSQPNKDLDLLKADHYVLGYEKRFTENLVGNIEFYYQHLYDLPVEDSDTSYFCTINESYDYRYVALVNDGVGKNYGVELTLERFFDNNYYFLVNGSLYNSKYKSLEGKWRNTLYNGNYIVNILCGKEFKNIGKKQNKTIALNAKAYFGGGQRYLTLLRDENGNIAVDPENNQYWDYSKAYDNDLVHVYNVNFSISYKINKANSTHEIFLDLMNVLNGDAKLSEFYDESKPDKVGYEEQMIFLPNIMYRVYF